MRPISRWSEAVRSGGCQCGAARYETQGEPVYAAMCHCSDCRASSGAPAVAWMAFRQEQVTLLFGELTTYVGSSGSQRQFCPLCGTGLFFRNDATLPGLIDVQLATLDDPGANPPAIHVQCAERLPWMENLADLPAFARYPGAVGG